MPSSHLNTLPQSNKQVDRKLVHIQVQISQNVAERIP